MADTNITATVLRRKLREALKTVESGKGRILITRHNKVVAALIGGADLMALKLDGKGTAVVSVTPEPAPAPAAAATLTEEHVKEAFEKIAEAPTAVALISEV